MARGSRPSTPVLEALHKRLDKINNSRYAQWRAFEFDPSRGVPVDSDATADEAAAIMAAIDREEALVAQKEAMQRTHEQYQADQDETATSALENTTGEKSEETVAGNDSGDVMNETPERQGSNVAEEAGQSSKKRQQPERLVVRRRGVDRCATCVQNGVVCTVVAGESESGTCHMCIGLMAKCSVAMG